jgi:hypothetical protein
MTENLLLWPDIEMKSSFNSGTMAVCWLHRSHHVIKKREANCGSQNPYFAVMDITLGMVLLTAKNQFEASLIDEFNLQ